MPTKLVALLALFLGDVALSTVNQLDSGRLLTLDLITTVITLLLVFGLLRGSEAVRGALIAVAIIDLLAVLIGLLVWLGAGFEGQSVIGIVRLGLRIALGVYILYALEDRGLLAWMEQRRRRR